MKPVEAFIADIDKAWRLTASELAGTGTKLATRHRMYAEIVGNGIPFLRQSAR